MRKTIYLKIEYQELKNKNISEEDQLKFKTKTFKNSLKIFKNDFKDLLASKDIIILKENNPTIVVEYFDEIVYSKLVKNDIVETIDSQIY